MATTSTERVRAMRERRRQALAEADAAEIALRPADDLLGPAIEETLSALNLKAADAAVAQMARQYARAIDRAKDQAWAARWLMPLLLDCLVSLTATPAARAKVSPASRGKQPPSWLDNMRQARGTGPV